mgnify:CR=1 FL=1
MPAPDLAHFLLIQAVTQQAAQVKTELDRLVVLVDNLRLELPGLHIVTAANLLTHMTDLLQDSQENLVHEYHRWRAGLADPQQEEG